MWRLYRGGMLINIHTRIAVLSCALAAALLSSQNVGAISVEPLLDTVRSIARLDEPSSSSDESKVNSGKSADKTPAVSSAANKSSNMNTQPAVGGDVSSAPVLVAEPIDPLPVIDAKQMELQPVRMRRPAATIATPSVVFGVSTTSYTTPLQATSQGWKLFGVAWYWWLGVAVVLYYLIRRVVYIRYRQNTSDKAMVG